MKLSATQVFNAHTNGYIGQINKQYFMQNEDNTKDLAYWLSTTSTLLFLMQRTIKANNTTAVAFKRNRSSPISFFGRMAQVDYDPLKSATMKKL